MRKKLPIAISSCLLGHEVRYDGRAKPNSYIQDELSEYFTFQVICPEVEIGLDVPRPPIKLTRVNGQIQAVSIDEPKINYTQQLRNHAWLSIPSLSNINAYIFKARSPSCGVGTTVLNENENVNGVFAQEILKVFPDLPIIDETCLESAEDRMQFLNAVFEYAEKTN